MWIQRRLRPPQRDQVCGQHRTGWRLTHPLRSQCKMLHRMGPHSSGGRSAVWARFTTHSCAAHRAHCGTPSIPDDPRTRRAHGGGSRSDSYHAGFRGSLLPTNPFRRRAQLLQWAHQPETPPPVSPLTHVAPTSPPVTETLAPDQPMSEDTPVPETPPPASSPAPGNDQC